MTRPYPDLGGASDWLKEIFKPIRSTTQIWVVTRHQYRISALISQTSFRGETFGGVTKSRLFSHALRSYMSLPNGRGSWVVGTSRGSWVWVWVKVVGVGNV